MPKELPDIVNVYWVQGVDGHRGISQIVLNYTKDTIKGFEDRVNRLFEAGRDTVIVNDTLYRKILDQAEIIIKGEPTVHLRYKRTDEHIS